MRRISHLLCAAHKLLIAHINYDRITKQGERMGVNHASNKIGLNGIAFAASAYLLIAIVWKPLLEDVRITLFNPKPIFDDVFFSVCVYILCAIVLSCSLIAAVELIRTKFSRSSQRDVARISNSSDAETWGIARPHRVEKVVLLIFRAAVLGVGVFGIGVALQEMAATVNSSWIFSFRQDIAFEASAAVEILSLSVSCLIAPVFEEIWFRGYIINALCNAGVSFAVANTIQAFAFGSLHYSVVQCLYASVLGILLGVVSKQRGTIVSAVIAHSVANSPIPEHIYKLIQESALKLFPLMNTGSGEIVLMGVMLTISAALTCGSLLAGQSVRATN